MDKGYDRQPTLRSRRLRNNPTAAEVKLWTLLRNRQSAGTRFNRQVPIGPYICDFVARTARLIIEGDGGQHAIHQNSDAVRSDYLRAQGYSLIRFWNNEVLENMEGVAVAIKQSLMDRPSPSPSRLREGRNKKHPSRKSGGE